MNLRSNWRRVSREHVCPICKKPDWCVVSVDGAVALCQRIESGRRCGEGGWLHRLKERPFYPQRRVDAVPMAPVANDAMERLAAAYQRSADPGEVHRLAVSLGLSTTVLCRFGLGWSVRHRAWSFPMQNAEENITGIRLRRPDGFKFAVTGSKDGLFVPAARSADSSPLLLAEGVTDAAALIDMGFNNVIGRPSCSGGIRVVPLILQANPIEVVVVADGDEPGRRGAASLASVLAVYAPSVRLISPPVGIKDARAWLLAGGRREDVQQAIDAAPRRDLPVKGVRA